MSLYATSSQLQNPTGLQETQAPKANQACQSCKKQKRKCSKTLPACTLCERMNRPCDYSDSSAAPTADDFNAMRHKLMQLESRLNSGHSPVAQQQQQSAYPTPSSSGLTDSGHLGQPQGFAFTPPQEIPWQAVQNRFPPIAFLDGSVFQSGRIVVPKSNVEVPADVLESLGDSEAVQTIIATYFSTVHRWMPIVSQKRMTRNMANPMWEAGPDLALLLLAMKLIISGSPDGVEASQSMVYVSVKRFVALMEAAGTVSILLLQANILVAWYEYGQAIYPAAWMTAGWCVRYGNMLGINNNNEALQLLGPLGTWVEQEERRRTWWGALLTDRIVSIGSQSYIVTSQEPRGEDMLPVNDAAWDSGDMTLSIPRRVQDSIDGPVPPFPRLCQASIMMGKVIAHKYKDHSADEKARHEIASQLYAEACNLACKITEEVENAPDYLDVATPLALAFSTLCFLCDSYSCPSRCDVSTPEAAVMQVQAIDGLKTVSTSIVAFANKINDCTPSPLDIDRVSPIIMDAMYSAASNCAWLVRESGDQGWQQSLDTIRHCLRKLGTRWRNAAEYLRVLEAQEFTYAVGAAT